MKIIEQKAAVTYFKNASSALMDDAELLKSYMGISEFGYSKLFHDNKYFYLSSDPRIIDACAEILDDPIIFYDKISLTHNEYTTVLWPSSPTNYAMALCQKYNYWNGATVFKKNLDSIELFWFSSYTDNDSASKYYIKNYKLLVCFVQYWLKKNRKMLKLDAPEVLAKTADVIDFSNLDKIKSDIKLEQDVLKEFLNQIQLKGVNLETELGTAHITPRELECLHLFSKGNTGKEMASVLGLSPRTIEGHMNSIRGKLGFMSKSNIIKLYREQIVRLEY
jgi:DNA-binding CsgD family transcriptional regulator